MVLPYTPEFLAHLRQRYEETDEPVTSLAADFGIDEKTVTRIARRSKWCMRSERRALPRHIQLLDAARDSAAAPPHPSWPGRATDLGSTRDRQLTPKSAKADLGGPSPGHPRLEMQHGREDVDARNECGHDGQADAEPSDASPLDRLERLVLKEIEIEEAQRMALGDAQRAPAEAAHKARAYSTLIQTLQMIERARSNQDAPLTGSFDDPTDLVPQDVDEFRRALARRIDAFVAGRADARHAEGSGEAEVVDEAR